jgi:hypothetical protein
MRQYGGSKLDADRDRRVICLAPPACQVASVSTVARAIGERPMITSAQLYLLGTLSGKRGMNPSRLGICTFGNVCASTVSFGRSAYSAPRCRPSEHRRRCRKATRHDRRHQSGNAQQTGADKQYASRIHLGPPALFDRSYGTTVCSLSPSLRSRRPPFRA